jgi:hypothetical protein
MIAAGLDRRPVSSNVNRLLLRLGDVSPTQSLSPEAEGPGVILRLALVASLLYVSPLIVFVWVFGYDMFRSDVAGFWRLSLFWNTPFSTYWVPAYPILIAFARMVTFDQLAPVAVMWPIAATFYVLSVIVTYRLLRHLTIPHPSEFALIYAAFPVVGMVGSINPVATNMAMAVFLLTALALSEERWSAFGMYAGLAFVTHKALWFFLLPLLGITFVRSPRSRPFVVLSALPLAVLWGSGTVLLGDPMWMVAWSAKNLMWSPGSLPVFDGLITSLLSRSVPTLAKGVFVLVLGLTAGASLYYSLLRHFWLGVAICTGTIAMITILNQHEVLAAAHYARLLVIPVAFCSVSWRRLPAEWRWRALVTAFIVGIVTNFAFAEYVTAYFFSGPGEGR